MDIKSVVEFKPNPNVPQVHPGDTIKVSLKVKEGDRERVQLFQGIVIRVRGGGSSASFTVRRVSYGIGVERTFVSHSPLLQKVEVLKQGDVSRARLYYLRKLSAKEARIKEKARVVAAPAPGAAAAAPGPQQAPAEPPAQAEPGQ